MSGDAQRGDAELVGLVVAGETEAFGEIVHRYKDAVMATAFSLLRDHHLAQDCAQETFLDAYMSLAALRERERLKPWLCGIARNKALRMLSRSRRVLPVAEMDFLPDTASPDDRLLAAEQARDILRAFSRLRPRGRQVAELYFLHHLTTPQIARRLGLPVGTVTSRLSDARARLKGELKTMVDTHRTPDFEQTVMEKIKELDGYYHNHDADLEGLPQVLRDTEAMVMQLPEGQTRQPALAEVYSHSYHHDNTDANYQKAREAAQKGGNYAVLTDLLTQRSLSIPESQRMDYFNHQALPEMETLGYAPGVARLLLWRGILKLKPGKDGPGAMEDFARALDLLQASAPDDIYTALAAAMLRAIKLHEQNADSAYVPPFAGTYMLGEGLHRQGSAMVFAGQPGYNCGRYDNRCTWQGVLYFASRFDGVPRTSGLLFDTDMRPGQVRRARDGKGTLELVSLDETITVSAGTFDKCMHLRAENAWEEISPSYGYDVWYAPGVGIVQFHPRTAEHDECYQLSEVHIAGGEGYLPLCRGNRWCYTQDLPDHLYQCEEHEIIWSDGERANFASVEICVMRKNAVAEGVLEAEDYISLCDWLCDDWKVDEATDMLRRAVRANTNRNATDAALRGIAFLERAKGWVEKGYRFCPSGYMASWLTAAKGASHYEEGALYSFGPYRWGTRHEENRIFGVKPFRYLQWLCGGIWKDAWVPGYTERHPETPNGVLTLEVCEGGSITTAAGCFDNCRKLTVRLARTEDSDLHFFHQYTDAGTKEFWFAPGVGVVRFDCNWGDELSPNGTYNTPDKLTTRCELTAYTLPAGGDEYLPLHIGNRWEYDELTLTAEGYRAKRLMEIAAGVGGKYLLCESQDFIFLGTQEQYTEAWEKE